MEIDLFITYRKMHQIVKCVVYMALYVHARTHTVYIIWSISDLYCFIMFIKMKEQLTVLWVLSHQIIFQKCLTDVDCIKVLNVLTGAEKRVKKKQGE